jgi:hypothetical protein
MSESFIEPDSLNATLLALGAVVDENGSTRFINKELASYNFDGVIPTSSDTILVNELEVGMSFLPIGETEGSLKTIIKIDFDDPEMTGSPTNDYIISYLGTNGEIETVVYDGDENIEVYFEDWDDKVLGDNGWIITQEGNAIFSNVAVRGRIEATEGFLEDLGITGTLTVESGGSIVVGTDPGTAGNPGIIIDDSGLFAFDDNENVTLSITASTGEVLISALDQVIEDLEDFVEAGFDDLDSLLSSSYVANFQIFNPGTTLISGNKISTGTIDANSVSISSGGGGATQGVKINQNGITAYDSFGLPTFFLNSANGNATFIGTVSGSDVIGSSFRSNTSITANSGTGIYLDDFGQARFANSNSTLSFDSTGLSIFGADIYLSGGSLTSDEFSIDSLGNATFSGTLSAADGTFSGTLSAADGTFTGTLSGVDGTFEGTLSAGVSISSPTISGGSISGTTVTGGLIRTATSGNRIILNGSGDAGFLEFYYFTRQSGIVAYDPGLSLFGNPAVISWNNFRVIGNIDVTTSGSKIAPSSFSNAQTNLQIRTSDNVIGIQSSNLNIKENIIPLTGAQSDVVTKEKDGLGKDYLRINPDNIFEITPVQYSIVGENPEIKEIGFIVEDLLQKWPAAVSFDNNNNPISYNTNSIVAGLIYAVKKQKDLIENLEKRIIKLEMESK